MATPRVSVICIFFNAERFLAEAIESVLAQDFQDFELILADDGSSDRSSGIALDYALRDPGRVRYVEHEDHANRGMSAARNLGLAHARGEFVAFIDADDRWRRGKIGGQLAVFDAQPDAGMVCGTVNYWSSWAGGKDRLIPTGRPIDGVSKPPETLLILYPLGFADAPCPSDVMIRRSVVERVGGFEERFTGSYEDQAFFVKVYLAAPVYFSSNVWLDYRRHEASSMATTLREGGYRRARGDFLEWLAGFLASHDIPARKRVERALRKALWQLAHPWAWRAERRVRRLAAKVFG